jgi:DNA recombination protein RmuC
MDFLIFTLVVLFGVFVVVIWSVRYMFNYLKKDVEAMRKEVGEGVLKTAEMTREQFTESSKIIREVGEKMIKLDDTNKQVLEFSRQLESLQDTLKNPKQRGVFGEYYLETLLKNAFTPKHYQMQYYFNDNTHVDAVLFFGEKIIPIDSKFSLETYNRISEEKNEREKEKIEKQFIKDLKNRIEETAKYIRPKEGTVDFAFMFIPAEGIYYDLLVNKIGTTKASTRDLIEYAVHEKNVHIVSPTTFYVTLQSLWQGMRAYHIQEKTKEIVKNISVLSKHLKVYEEHMNRLGSQMDTTVKTYNRASQELKKIDKDITRITGESPEIETKKIDS